MSRPIERWVRLRARDRCEYCRISQLGQEATFHVDHVVPRHAGGATADNNLALACVSCSLRKGARTVARDPVSGSEVAIFNPRRESWDAHFVMTPEFALEGLTPTGRASIELLRMNRPNALIVRALEAQLGWR